MARIVADRVLESSTTTGTGAYTLAGAVTGYRAASAVCANGDTFTYYAEDVDTFGRVLGGWETGLGTWGTGNILTRTTIYASSNAGAAVSWAAGTRRIALTLVSNASLGPTTVTGAIASTSTVTGTQLISNIAQGTAPLTVTSTTKVVNLNADLLDNINSTQFLRSDNSIVVGHHAEGRNLINAFLTNDFANARLRGATFTWTNIAPGNTDIDNMFNGTSTFYSINVVATTWPIVIEFTLPKTLTYTASLGIGFGNSIWRCNSVLIEAYSENAWVTCVNTTSNTSEDVYTNISGNAGIGTTKVRYTLGNPNHAEQMRITHLWGWNFASDGWSQLMMPRAGGTMYGQLNAPNYTSTIAPGTAPFTVTSTTKVNNLNVDQVDGYHAAEASTVSTIAARNSSGDLNVRLIRQEYTNETTISGGMVYRVNNTTDNYLRICSDVAAIRTYLGAYASSNPSGYTTNTGTVTSVSLTVPTGLSIAGSPITTTGTLALTFTAGYSIPTTTSQSNWDTAYTDRNKWDGGSTGLAASTGRTSLGATTLGSNLFTISNVAAISFPRFNADNTVSSLDAASFRTAIGAGTSSTTGTVTSVGGTGTVSGLTLSGTVTGTGNLTLGGTLAVAASAISTGTVATDRLGSGTANSSSYLRGDQTWSPIAAGATITNDTTANSNAYYPTFSTVTSGSWATAYISTTKIYFNPSTGTLNSTTFNSLSDARYKKNLVQMSDSMSIINSLVGYRFDWKDGSGSSYGILAQDLEKVMPDAVTETEDKKTINYAALVPVLLEAIKELQSEILLLKAK